MRIRTIKPEFWRSDDIAKLDWQIIHDGPIPHRVNTVAPMHAAAEYVYMLFDRLNRLLYVGRSFRPADRFTKHRRKPWWKRVSGAVIIRITDTPTFGPGVAGPNTIAFEKAAIRDLAPTENVAGVMI